MKVSDTEQEAKEEICFAWLMLPNPYNSIGLLRMSTLRPSSSVNNPHPKSKINFRQIPGTFLVGISLSLQTARLRNNYLRLSSSHAWYFESIQWQENDQWHVFSFFFLWNFSHAPLFFLLFFAASTWQYFYVPKKLCS